jgi:hypothetical protein
VFCSRWFYQLGHPTEFQNQENAMNNEALPYAVRIEHQNMLIRSELLRFVAPNTLGAWHDKLRSGVQRNSRRDLVKVSMDYRDPARRH